MSYVFGYKRNIWAITTLVIITIFLLAFNMPVKKPSLVEDGLIISIVLFAMILIHRVATTT